MMGHTPATRFRYRTSASAFVADAAFQIVSPAAPASCCANSLYPLFWFLHLGASMSCNLRCLFGALLAIIVLRQVPGGVVDIYMCFPGETGRTPIH
jgi:hypothetical protein